MDGIGEGNESSSIVGTVIPHIDWEIGEAEQAADNST